MGRIGKEPAVGCSVHNLHGRVEPEDGFAFAVPSRVNRRDAFCLGHWRREMRVGHSERLQNLSFDVGGIGLARDDLDYAAEDEQRRV